MNISIHIDEHFQIINTRNLENSAPSKASKESISNIFDKVSGKITTLIGKLVYKSLSTEKEAIVKHILANTSDKYTFLTVGTRPIGYSSIGNKVFVLTFQQDNEVVGERAHPSFRQKSGFKPLNPDSEQDLWDFLEEAEVGEIEEIEVEDHYEKIKERFELLLRETEKQGVEWIKMMDDLKLSMSKLKESEQTKKALLEAVPDAMFQVNKEGDYLEYIPSKDEKSIPAAAFIGNNMKDILPDEYAQEAIIELRISLETGRVRAYSFEWELEESLRYFEMRFSPINDKEALCIIRDITEQKRGEELLRKSVMHYQDLIKRSPAPIMILDKEAKFVEVNHAALVLLGVSHKNQLKNRRAYDFIHKNFRSLAKDKLKRGFHDSIPDGTAQYKGVKFDGGEMTVEVAGALMTLGGKRVIQLILKEVNE